MEDKIYITTEDGEEIEMEIIFTFSNEELNKNYVVYLNPDDEEGEVFVSIYDEDNNLFPIEDEEEWDFVKEVYESYLNEDEFEA